MIIDQFLEGLLYSLITIVYLPVYSRNGILNLFVSILYIWAFALFNYYIYVMISICTVNEIKYEKEVLKITFDEKCELNYLNSPDWKNELYRTNNKYFVEFVNSFVE